MTEDGRAAPAMIAAAAAQQGAEADGRGRVSFWDFKLTRAASAVELCRSPAPLFDSPDAHDGIRPSP